MSGKRSPASTSALSGVLGGQNERLKPRASGGRTGSPLGGSPLGGSPLGGQGLGALIPGGRGIGRLMEVNLDQIQPDPKQPRKRFQVEALDELADSIKAQGILQPLIVTQLSGGRYQIIAGERRWRAARLAGLKAVPVVCREAGEQEAFELALLENIQRVDLTPLEEALSYHRLVEEFSLSHEQIAERTGKRRSTISNALRLLRLPPEVIELLDLGTLSAGHGRALLGLNEAEQMIDFAQMTVHSGWSVRELERRVRIAVEQETEPALPLLEVAAWVSPLAGDLNAALERNGISAKIMPDRQGGVQLKLSIQDEATARAFLKQLNR